MGQRRPEAAEAEEPIVAPAADQGGRMFTPGLLVGLVVAVVLAVGLSVFIVMWIIGPQVEQ
ncbi:MAG: hypothetical protein ACE5FA_12360, partial [Dehalococcoidia bacterium]